MSNVPTAQQIQLMVFDASLMLDVIFGKGELRKRVQQKFQVYLYGVICMGCSI